MPLRSRSRFLRVPLILALIAIVFWLSGCMERYFYHPTVEFTPVPAEFHDAESVTFHSKDGTQLHGWFIPSQLPANASGHPAPTIVHIHGNAGSILSHIGFTDYLPHAGFNLFIFDYRGYGQSEGAARSRKPLIADAIAAIEYLIARDDIDPQRIAIYGQSLGGAIGLNVMAERDEVKAAVIESAFTSWRDMAACALGGDGRNIICRVLSTLLISDSHRADHAITDIQRPVLLIHGMNDSIIPISHSRALLKASNETAHLLELSEGDHNSLRDANPELEQAVIEFFRRSLSAPLR